MSLIKDIWQTIKRSRMTKAQRDYAAGQVNRFNMDWMPSTSQINLDIRNNGKRIRERALDLSKNNPYANSIDIKDKTNIVGHEGFRLQVRAEENGKLDEYANSLIESKFEKWSKKQYCTMTGRYTFLMVQWMLVHQLRFVGEFLVRMITNIPLAENPFGFSLEILDPDDLDETYSEELSNGRVVIMGVEIDEWRKIHAFYFKKKNVKDEIWGGYGRDRIRIEASEVIYGFNPQHPKQVRGVTKLASVLGTLKGIDRWEESSLINATLASRKMGFIHRKNLEAEEQYNAPQGSGNDPNNPNASAAPTGGKYLDFEAGIIEELPYGYEFTGFDPKFPHEQHTPFLKSMLRKIAAALGFNYNSFASDLEGVSYSSMRQGLIDERDNWMCEQSLFRDLFLTTLYEHWLKYALMTKEVNLPYAKYEKFSAHAWQPRRWPWVDPLKDIQAKILAVKMGWETNSQVCAEYGGVYYDNLRSLAMEYKWAEELGLKLGEDISISVNVGPENNSDENANRENIIKLKAS